MLTFLFWHPVVRMWSVFGQGVTWWACSILHQQSFVPSRSVPCSSPNSAAPPSSASFQTYAGDFLSRLMDWVFTMDWASIVGSLPALFRFVIPLVCHVNSPSSFGVHTPVVLCKISPSPVLFPQFLWGSGGPCVLVAALSFEPTWDTRIQRQHENLESSN